MDIISLEVMRALEYMVHVNQGDKTVKLICREWPISGERSWTNTNTWTTPNEIDLAKLNRFVDGLYNTGALNRPVAV